MGRSSGRPYCMRRYLSYKLPFGPSSLGCAGIPTSYNAAAPSGPTLHAMTIEELMANAQELHRDATENFARAYACWEAGDWEGARAFGQDGRISFTEAAI